MNVLGSQVSPRSYPVTAKSWKNENHIKIQFPRSCRSPRMQRKLWKAMFPAHPPPQPPSSPHPRTPPWTEGWKPKHQGREMHSRDLLRDADRNWSRFRAKRGGGYLHLLYIYIYIYKEMHEPIMTRTRRCWPTRLSIAHNISSLRLLFLVLFCYACSKINVRCWLHGVVLVLDVTWFMWFRTVQTLSLKCSVCWEHTSPMFLDQFRLCFMFTKCFRASEDDVSIIVAVVGSIPALSYASRFSLDDFA